MKTLPLTVLAYEGPMATAYLSGLQHAGYQPSKIILMVAACNPDSGRKIGRWLPRRWRLGYLEKVQTSRMAFWPNQIRLRHPGVYEKMIQTIGEGLSFPESMFENVLHRPDYSSFCHVVERVMLEEGLNDPQLHQTLSQQDSSAILFTGGGILPASLLNIEGLRFIHIHPGHLPDVRGADGLLWSTLVRGRPGATSFYMAAGIDTGELLLAMDLSPLTFPLNKLERPDDQTLYRALFSYYDPMIRTYVLLKTLETLGTDLLSLPSKEQDLSQGITYHFMHPKMREKALQMLFPRQEC